mgnify:FL=1
MIIGPCTVVTGGPEPKVLEGAGIRVVGAHIAQIAAAGDLGPAYPNEAWWHAHDRVVMPGFVNSHAHLARHLARGLGLREPAEWRAYDRALSAEDVKQAVTAALVEGLHHGVTTVVDFHRSGACLDLSLSEVMGAAHQVGVRVATCYGASEDDTPLERRNAIDESVGFAKELARQRHGRQRGMLGVHATTLKGIETLLAEAMEAAGRNYAVHVDLALDLTPAERWGRHDVLPAEALPALWAHAERAPRDLLGAVRDRGDALSASGASATAAQLRESDLAWGSDEGINAPPIPEGAFAPRTSEAHYRRLFVNGARWAADHFGEELGVLAPGAPADLIMFDYRPATELSNRTIMQHLWSGLLRSRVIGAMVAGNPVMDDGVVLKVDEYEVARQARECAARVWNRLG